MTLMAVALFHGSTSRSRAAAILAPAKFGMRPCGGNGKRATPSATSLSQTHCRAALLSAKSPAMTESGAARPGDSQGRKLPLQGFPAGSLAGVEIIKQSEDPVDVGVLVILNHIVESRLVPRNICGHQSSEQWNLSRQLPIARSPARQSASSSSMISPRRAGLPGSARCFRSPAATPAGSEADAARFAIMPRLRKNYPALPADEE